MMPRPMSGPWSAARPPTAFKRWSRTRLPKAPTSFSSLSAAAPFSVRRSWRMRRRRHASCARRRSVPSSSCRASPMSTRRSNSQTRPNSVCRAPASPRASRPHSRSPASSGSARSGSTTPAGFDSTPIRSAALARAASGAKACATRWKSCRSGSSRACALIHSSRHMTAIGLIGCGGMAQDVVAALRTADTASGVRIVGALARPGRGERARAKLCAVDILEGLDDLIARKPAVVAEVASQAAVAEHGPTVLRSGIDCLVISIGALADPTVFGKLKSAAREGNSRILLPAGAVGGIDAIAAMRLGGLTSVRYRSRKPPLAWRGSPAERLVDLGKLTERTVLYKGTAGEAALLYPQNANVAAAVALAGLGFDATEGEIEAEGAAGRFAIQLQGKPSRTNPKTSALAALSVARALINEQATIVI